ncbi:MAG: hypothetical protein V3W41_00775 [Planctomycetota bacterium]
MTKLSKVGGAIDGAIRDVNAEILKRALAALPQNATVGEIIEGFDAADFGGELRALNIKEFLGAIGAVSAKRGPGRPKGSAKTSGDSPKAAKLGARNTRTAQGREELVRDAFAALSKLGGQAQAADIRVETGGEASQIRRAMQTLLDQKMVKRSGNARATEYSLS